MNGNELMEPPERVRLVIWDLDGTFWNGTVTEEGFVYDRASHDIVVQLAERGIVSSICSKNDLGQIKGILSAEGIWDYFVLPSINWEPKGHRLRNLVEMIGLRPETVLFIDDNPLNLQEVKFHLPGIQISGQEIIPALLSDPRFIGKDDRNLSRLKQYKVLQQRQEDSVSSGNTNVEFLRTCDVTVEFEFDVAKYVDRAIELINRTNQLNFTKLRLPEDLAEARAQLLEFINKPGHQASLVHVKDKYGDHGFAGLYAMRSAGGTRRLLHFCFSCRILNMGVEKWVYQKLGMPILEVSGEVLSDVFDQSQEVDWIRQVSENDADTEATGEFKNKFPAVFARGGCDVSAVMHYFSLVSNHLVAELNFPRNGCAIRLDHTQMLRYAIDGLTPEQAKILFKLGYVEEDFRTTVFAPSTNPAVRIFSCWADGDVPLYRHRSTGLLVPLRLRGMNKQNVLKWPPEKLRELEKTDVAKRALAFLFEEFDYADLISEDGLKSNIETAFNAVSSYEKIYVILGLDQAPVFEIDEKPAWSHHWKARLNRWLHDIAAAYPNVTLIDIASSIKERKEILSTNHFERMVYFRLYSQIRSEIEKTAVELEAQTQVDMVVASSSDI